MLTEGHSPERFEIDPRHYEKSVAYLGCLAAWTAVMLGGAVYGYYAGNHGMIYCGFVLASLALVLSFLQRRKVYEFEATSNGVVMTVNRNRRDVILFSQTTPLELSLERVDHESFTTLNLWIEVGGHRQRHLPGIDFSSAAKQEIFKGLLVFLRRHGIEVETRNEFES